MGEIAAAYTAGILTVKQAISIAHSLWAVPQFSGGSKKQNPHSGLEYCDGVDYFSTLRWMYVSDPPRGLGLV